MNCISWNFHPEFQQGRQQASKALIQKIKVWQNSKQPESNNSDFCTIWSAYQREILFSVCFDFDVIPSNIYLVDTALAQNSF